MGRVALDPRAILTSIGEVVYDWDVATDRISWGVNAADVLGVADLSTLSSGREFALATEPGNGQTRHEAIFSSKAVDQGSGVPYRTRYAVRLKPDCLVSLEDTGRWYSDADGRPAFAHGVIRIDRTSSLEREAPPRGGQGRSEFLAQIRSEVAETARGKRSMILLVAAIDGPRPPQRRARLGRSGWHHRRGDEPHP